MGVSELASGNGDIIGLSVQAFQNLIAREVSCLVDGYHVVQLFNFAFD